MITIIRKKEYIINEVKRQNYDLFETAKSLGFIVSFDYIVNNAYRSWFINFDLCKTLEGNKKSLYDENKDLSELFVRGFLCINEENRLKTIIIEKNQDEKYQNFAMAYLLSQFCLYDIKKKDAIACIENNYDKDSLKLCRDLLISTDKLNGKKDIKKICDKFKVPDFIAAQKIRSLGGK